jgi:leader peptidase (prepilin peptidase) / N-methyltransferase
MRVAVRLAGRAGWTSDDHPCDSRSRAVPPSVVAATLGVTIAAVLVLTGSPVPAALSVAMTVPAAVVDAVERRLPDPWLVRATTMLLVGLAVAGATAGTPVADELRAAAAGALAMASPLLVLHLASPAAMGFGDVKAAAVLGAALGTVDWRLTLAALALAAGSAAVFGVARRPSSIPFGPFLVAGSTVVLATAPLSMVALQGGDP